MLLLRLVGISWWIVKRGGGEGEEERRTLEHGLCEGQAGGDDVGGGFDVHDCGDGIDLRLVCIVGVMLVWIVNGM